MNATRLQIGLMIVEFACIAGSCSNGKDKPTTNQGLPEFRTGDRTDATGTPAAPPARPLKLGAIRPTAQLTKEQFLSEFGPPEAVEGSGVEYLVYQLDDGRRLWLLFAARNPHPLLKVIVFSREGREIVFDDMTATGLR